jgi:hypothetical protein
MFNLIASDNEPADTLYKLITADPAAIVDTNAV